MIQIGRGDVVAIVIMVIVMAIAILLPVASASENLTFSGIPPTLIPQTYAQYYENISENDKNWVTIANVVPRPFVDYFGENSQLGWQVFFLILIGVMFLIMFGRQSNVILPVITFIIVGAWGLTLFPNIIGRWIYTLVGAAMAGVIIYLGRSKR